MPAGRLPCGGAGRLDGTTLRVQGPRPRTLPGWSLRPRPPGSPREPEPPAPHPQAGTARAGALPDSLTGLRGFSDPSVGAWGASSGRKRSSRGASSSGGGGRGRSRAASQRQVRGHSRSGRQGGGQVTR